MALDGMDYELIAALEGRAYNVLTPRFQLSGADEKFCLYIRNDHQSYHLITSRYLVSLGASVSPDAAEIMAYEASGESPPTTFKLPVTSRLLGDTRTPAIIAHGGNAGFSMSLGASAARSALAIRTATGTVTDSNYTLPPGGSVAISLRPPAGNVDMWARLSVALILVERKTVITL